MSEQTATELQARFNRLNSYDSEDMNVGLTFKERRMIEIALKIAHHAVVHHDTLVNNARNGHFSAVMDDAARTSNEIYKGAEEFKHWRDR